MSSLPPRYVRDLTRERGESRTAMEEQVQTNLPRMREIPTVPCLAAELHRQRLKSRERRDVKSYSCATTQRRESRKLKREKKWGVDEQVVE